MSEEKFETDMEDFIKEECNKDIDQSDKIDDSQIEQSLGEMGYLWDTVRTKLEKDAVCFNCKKDIEISSDKFMVREASKVEKGVVAFVSICDECVSKNENKNEVKKNE